MKNMAESNSFLADHKIESEKGNVAYLEIPFGVETPIDEFYKFMSVTQIAETDRTFASVRIRCRTMGVLHSANGQYCLKNMDRQYGISCEVVVSAEFLPLPPKPAIVPYTAQIFGFLGFEDEHPVIFAIVVQPMPHNTACRIHEIMNLICGKHLATSEVESQFK